MVLELKPTKIDTIETKTPKVYVLVLTEVFINQFNEKNNVIASSDKNKIESYKKLLETVIESMKMLPSSISDVRIDTVIGTGIVSLNLNNIQNIYLEITELENI